MARPVPVDRGDRQRQVPPRGLAEQVNGGQRAAGPAADGRDHGRPGFFPGALVGRVDSILH
jgi:hypothetical protein